VEAGPVVVFAGAASVFVSVFASALVSLLAPDELEPSDSELLVLAPPELLLDP
jgi:hypothetical protein